MYSSVWVPPYIEWQQVHKYTALQKSVMLVDIVHYNIDTGSPWQLFADLINMPLSDRIIVIQTLFEGMQHILGA